MRNDDVVRAVSKETGVPFETVRDVYRCYFRMMRDSIDSVDLFKRIGLDEFRSLRLNFPVLCFGSLRVRRARYITINKIKIWKIAHGEKFL